MNKITESIHCILPQNKIGLLNRRGCVDVYCYSNKLETLLGWKANKGSKYKQQASIPEWIKRNKKFSLFCLKGLIETDGSIYYDRGYRMINFTTTIPQLARDVSMIITKLKFKAYARIIKHPSRLPKYVIRISKNVNEFINLTGINKS